jgi:anti-sigma factor RsiW
MMCKKPELSEKLVLFIENLLPDDEQTEIRAHLEECERCRDEERSLRENISLLRDGAHVQGASSVTCPDEDILVTYQESPEKLIPKERRRLESHLAHCIECQQAFSLLKDISHDLEGEADPAPSAARIPRALREAMENLYGKPQKSGLLDRLLSIFQVRPGYSLLSALAVTLIIVGVLSLVFNDMAYQRAAHFSQSGMDESNRAIATGAPGEEGSMTRPAAVDQKMISQRAGSAPGRRDKTETFTVSAPAKERERSSCKEEKTQIVAKNKDAHFAIATGGAGAKQAGSDLNEKRPASSGDLASRDKLPSNEGALSDADNKLACGRTESLKKATLYGCKDDKEKDASSDESLKGSCRHQVSPPAVPSNRTGMQHPAMAGSPRLSQEPGKPDAVVVSKLSLEEQRAKLEREMSTSAQTCLDRMLGPGYAKVSVIVTADEKNETLSIKGVEVTVKSTKPINEELQGDLKKSLSAKLKLEHKRDRVKFTEAEPTH